MLKKVLDVISAANTLTLPMDVRRIAEHYGYQVQLYSQSMPQLEAFHLLKESEHHTGIALGVGEDRYVFLSDDINVEQERFVIAHEIGHIILGHVTPYPDQRSLTPKEVERQENEADLFALLLLAPPPLLDALGLDGPTGVRRCTGLSMNDSRKAYWRMQEYRRDQHEAHRRDDIAARARMAMQGVVSAEPPAPSDNAEVFVHVPQFLAATSAQEKAVW